jgi:ferredoxin-NADP reductase
MHKNIKSDGSLEHIQISLIYANVSPDDILLQQKLDILAKSHPNLKVKILFRKDIMVSQSVTIE